MKSDSDLTYHQKFNLVDNILRYVRETGAKSLLDIGACSTVTALPLAQSVETYVAIEKNPAAVACLKAANLEVVAQRFPVSLPFTFDMVLASHSIPERSVADYPSFLAAAWELTNPGGLLLLVTFKGSLGDLAQVRRETLHAASQNSPYYAAVMSYLEKRGEVRVERVNSYVEARSAEILADFIAPWMTAKKQEMTEIMPALVHIMKTRYQVRQNLFVFPFEHLFISCKKR